MTVTACLVTRGDVPMQPILDSLIFDEVIVWDNSVRENRYAYGRYEAARLATTDLLYFQDDDVILHPAQQTELLSQSSPGVLVANQKAGHQPPGFEALTFVAWGAVCERGLPEVAFERFAEAGHDLEELGFLLPGADIVFNLLTPTVTLDLGQNHRDFAHGADRLYRDPRYPEWKRHYYDEALKLR